MRREEDRIYHQLRAEIDKMPYGMPKTESGVEIRILKHMFSPEEAAIAVHLNVLPEPPKTIFNRVKKIRRDMTLDQLAEILDRLAKRGAILSERSFSKSKKLYCFALLAIGMFEFRVDRMTRSFYEDCEEYMRLAYKDEYYKYKKPQLRTVPIGKSLSVENNVAIYDDMREAIKRIDGQYVVANCVCRQGQDLIGESCRHTDLRETCIMFPGTAWRYLEFGSGRKVSKEEVFEILDRAEDAGLVLQPTNAVNPLNICCCCGDCCGAIKSAKHFPRPAELFSTNYRAQVNKETCSGCKICVKRCPMEAVTVTNKLATIDYDRCIGCGVCVPKCKESAMEMVKKKKTKIPPLTVATYFGDIMKKKIGITGVATAMCKYVAGKKI